MRGLIRATYHYNKLQAIKDWRTVTEFAAANDCTDLLPEAFDPNVTSVKKIDGAIGKTRVAMKERGINMPEVWRIRQEQPQ